MKKNLFLKFAIRETQKPQFYVWKTKVLGKLQKNYFWFTPWLEWWYSITTLVWFEQLLQPMNKNQLLKFANREIRKVPYENLNFFLGKLYQKTLFVLHSNYNGDIPCRLWFDLNNFLSQWERPFYQNTSSKLFEKKSEIYIRKPNFFSRPAIAEILFVLRSKC